MFRELKDFNFREIDRKFSITEEISDKTKSILNRAGLDIPDEDDMMLLYGYIDIEAGITFEFVCTCHRSDDGSLICTDRDKSMGFKLRYGSFTERLKVLKSGEYPERYDYIAKVIEEAYYDGTDYWETRNMEELDPFRMPGYPDDLQVLFLKERQNAEMIWTRCRDVSIDGRISVELLNEPDGDLGVHLGDKVYIIFKTNHNAELAFLCADLEAGAVK